MTAPPLFVLPPERARTFLKVAKWLAYVEGALTVFGSPSMLEALDVPRFALMLATGTALIGLGHLVGKGQVKAATLLLGLSALRWIVAASGSGRIPIGMMLIELAVYSAAVAAALSLDAERPPAERELGDRSDRLMGAARSVSHKAAAGADRAAAAAGEAVWAAAVGVGGVLRSWKDRFMAVIMPWPRSLRFDVALVILLVVHAIAAINQLPPGGEPGINDLVMFVILTPNVVFGSVLLTGILATLNGRAWGAKVRTVARIIQIVVLVLYYEFYLFPFTV